MAWKNGGGETLEVAVFPADADLAAFGWRISIAAVSAGGPFSAFPGVDRTLAILSGDGMALEIDGAAHRLAPGDAPLSFPADATTSARLLGGPVMDLNVMTRRGAYAHRMTRLRAFICRPVGVEGEAWAVAATAAALVVDGTSVRLAPLDALMLGDARSVVAEAAADVFLIEIEPLAQAPRKP